MALAGLALLAMALRSHRMEGQADPARSAPAAACADSPPVQEDRGGAKPRTAQTGPPTAMGGGAAIAVIRRRVRAAAPTPPAPKAGQIPQSRTPQSQAAAAWPRKAGTCRSAADGGDSSTFLIGSALSAAAPSLPAPGAARYSQPLLAAGQRWWHAPQRLARLRAPQAGRWHREAPRRCAGWYSGQPSSCCWRRPWSATSRLGGSSGGDSAAPPSMWRCAGSDAIRTGGPRARQGGGSRRQTITPTSTQACDADLRATLALNESALSSGAEAVTPLG